MRIALLSPPIRHQVFQGYGLSCFVIHHNFHILVFFIQLIQKLTASAAGHTAAASRRCFIPKSDKPLNFCLTAVHIHIQGGCTLGTQIHNTTARFNAKARVNTAVRTFQRTYYVMCINKGRHIFHGFRLYFRPERLCHYISMTHAHLVQKRHGTNEPILSSDITFENYSRPWIMKQLQCLQFYCGIHPRGFGRRCSNTDRCILSGRGGCRPRTLLTIRFRPSWCRTELCGVWLILSVAYLISPFLRVIKKADRFLISICLCI